MKMDLLNADTLAKVRDANCLTESEMQSLSATIAEMRVRRELDALDFEWEEKVKEHVILRRSKGGRQSLVMSSWAEVAGGFLLGMGLLAYGTYMLWQFRQVPKPCEALPVLFFAAITALGAWIVFGSWKTSKTVANYDRARLEYLSKRKLLTDQLPKESRFPVRYCPNCLSRLWHGKQHPSSPPR